MDNYEDYTNASRRYRYETDYSERNYESPPRPDQSHLTSEFSNFLFIIGFFLNGAFIILCIKYRSTNKAPNMFVASLTMGNLMVILFGVPFDARIHRATSKQFTTFACKLSEFSKDLSQCVSSFTLVAFSAYQYFWVVNPLGKLTRRIATRVSIVGIWILAVLLALPSAVFAFSWGFPEDGIKKESYRSKNFENCYCYPFPHEFDRTLPKAMTLFHFFVFYTLPLGIIVICCIITSRLPVPSRLPGETENQLKRIREKKEITKTIISMTKSFALCFLPHNLAHIHYYVYDFNLFVIWDWDELRYLGLLLRFAYSCFNPLILYCINGTLRKQFNDTIFCCGLCAKSANQQGEDRSDQDVGD